MREEQASTARHALSLLRKLDTKLDDVLLRLTMLERRDTVKGGEGVLDRLSVVELRQRIERRIELTS